MQTEYDVLIIGGGFSGAVLACQLSRCSSRAFSIAIVERKGLPGRGIAYGSPCRAHLLNSPAGNMSAYPEDPGHFVEWLRKHNPELASPTEFVARWLFGQYVGEQLDCCTANTPITFEWLFDEASIIGKPESDAVPVQLSSGRELTAKYVVLATGNCPPGDPAPFEGDGKGIYVGFAWSEDSLQGLPGSGSILILGSGLTAIDQVMALYAASFQGNIHMLSRHGLVPQMHCPGMKWTTEWANHVPRSTRGLLSAARREVRQAAAHGVDWRAVIDSMRSNTQRIWQDLPLEEKRRFLRHVRPYWEVHRHRYAPQVHCVLEELKESGRLSMIAGQVLDCHYRQNDAEVRYRQRITGEKSTLRVDRIVNCTGPDADFRKIQDKVTYSLISQGIARPDALSRGLDAGEDGALLNPSGEPSKALFALGPLRKGCLWETTAVPEIREQARSLARRLAAELEGGYS